MSSPDAATIIDTLTHGPHRAEPGRKQLTLALGGLYIASTTTSDKPILVWETEKGYPRHYIPVESLHGDIKSRLNAQGSKNDSKIELADSAAHIKLATAETLNGKNNDSKAVIEHLTVGSKTTTWVRFLEGPYKGFVRFERSELGGLFFSILPLSSRRLSIVAVSASKWKTNSLSLVDAWFENGAISVAIKNPYKRIDTSTVSRNIVVKVDGEIVAESNVAVLLNETGMNETYYIPATSIKNWGTVEKSDLRTACPYKGEAW
jgi:uncharacterized protein (DUF427 family)